MVALNEKFSHCGNLVSEGPMSPDVIEAIDFTTRSEEIRGGSVVNFGVSGFRGLLDASPLRRHPAAPVHRNDPESELHYVRNSTYSPALYTVLRQEPKSPGQPGRASKKIAVLREIQRDQIGYAGGINLYEYVGSRAVAALDPTGEKCRTCYGPHGPARDHRDHICRIWFFLYTSPSWYDYIWPWNYGRLWKIVFWPLKAISKKNCNPHVFQCAGSKLKGQMAADMASEEFRHAPLDLGRQFRYFELGQWGWAITGGAAGGMSGEMAGQPITTGLGGLHDAAAADGTRCPMPKGPGASKRRLPRSRVI